MVKFNYGKSRNTANKLIDKFGAVGAVLRYPGYEPEAVTLVIVAYSNRQIDGTRVREQDRQIFISPLSPSGNPVVGPTTKDRIKDAQGVTYEIIRTAPVSPAGVDVLFEVQGRA